MFKPKLTSENTNFDMNIYPTEIISACVIYNWNSHKQKPLSVIEPENATNEINPITMNSINLNNENSGLVDQKMIIHK